MPKFTFDERNKIKTIVATLTLKRVSDNEIIEEIEKQSGKIITRQYLYNIRQQIKKESYDWYSTLREGRYEYIHEFKSRIEEILWLQQKHHDLIDNNKDNPQIQQTSLAELHKLNITLANYFDVAPEIINGITISTTSENTGQVSQQDTRSSLPKSIQRI